jgi:hypothetical protein
MSRFSSHQSVKVSNPEHELADQAGHALGITNEDGMELVQFDEDPAREAHAIDAEDLTPLNLQ